MDYITINGVENEMGKIPPDNQVEICKQWITEFAIKRKSINDTHSSYGLKHYAERWSANNKKGLTYVSNGAFIKAAIDLGYEYRRIRNGLNAQFNMSFPRKGTEKWRIAFSE